MRFRATERRRTRDECRRPCAPLLWYDFARGSWRFEAVLRRAHGARWLRRASTSSRNDGLGLSCVGELAMNEPIRMPKVEVRRGRWIRAASLQPPYPPDPADPAALGRRWLLGTRILAPIMVLWRLLRRAHGARCRGEPGEAGARFAVVIFF